MPLTEESSPPGAPFYTSGTFWTIIGIAVAIALGCWAVWAAFRSSNPKRTLHITTDQVVPLVTSAPGLEGRRIMVSLDGRQLTTPHVITVDIVSRSGKDITPEMFSSAPLELEFGTPIVALLNQYSDARRAAVRDPSVTLHNTALHVGPALLTRQHELRYTVLTEGQPKFRPVANLADVTILQTPAPASTFRRWPLVIGVVAFISLFLADMLDPNRTTESAYIVFAGLIAVASTFVDSMIGRRTRKRKGGRVTSK